MNPNDPDAEKLFKSINEAFTVLSDDEARRRYDETYRLAGTRGQAKYYQSGNVEMTQDQINRMREHAAKYHDYSTHASQARAKPRAKPDANFHTSDHIDFEEWNRMQFGPDAETIRQSARKYAEEAMNASRNSFQNAPRARQAHNMHESPHLYRSWAQLRRKEMAVSNSRTPWTLFYCALALGGAYYYIRKSREQ